MSYSLEIPPAVADEIEAIKLWHELRGKRLADKFHDELITQLEFIVENPKVFAIVSRDIRVARLKRFSYLIRYRIIGNRVRITSVVHSSRAKGRWRFRR